MKRSVKQLSSKGSFHRFFQVNCSNFRLKSVKRLGFIKIVEEIKFEDAWDELESK